MAAAPSTGARTSSSSAALDLPTAILSQSRPSLSAGRLLEPPLSYSSSEDEDETDLFHDANEALTTSDDRSDVSAVNVQLSKVERQLSLTQRKEHIVDVEGLEPEPQFDDDHVDFDELYEDRTENDRG